MSNSAAVLSTEDVDRVVTHMNEEHTEDLIHYAQAYADVGEVTSARMTSIDAEGLDLAVEGSRGTTPVCIDFDASLTTADKARAALVELAMAACEDAER